MPKQNSKPSASSRDAALHHQTGRGSKVWSTTKHYAKKTWHFLWEEDSFLSWLANIVLAYVLIRFLIYPGLGLLLGTSYPIVAVVSSSMDHTPQAIGAGYKLCGMMTLEKPQIHTFDDWWQACGLWYEERKITKAMFSAYPLSNGFRRGDLIVLTGANPHEVKVGDVLVFFSPLKQDPIIHRVVQIRQDEQGNYWYETKGDNNPIIYPELDTNISQDKVIGKGRYRIPYLGYIKIAAYEAMMGIYQFFAR